jgi:cell division protein FtsB
MLVKYHYRLAVFIVGSAIAPESHTLFYLERTMRLTELYSKLPPGEKRFFIIVCLLSFLLAAGWILFSSNGVMNYYAIQKELTTIQEENIQLAAENEELKNEIEKLKADPAYLEEVARKEYGLVKKNEMIFKFD